LHDRILAHWWCGARSPRRRYNPLAMTLARVIIYGAFAVAVAAMFAAALFLRR